MFLEESDKKSVGHYSPAIIHDKIVYISGQLPIKKGEIKPPSESIEEQTDIVLEKLNQILIAANSDKSKVVRTTIYVSDISYWDKVNKVYAEFFGSHRPARTIIPVKALHFGCLLELDAIAFID